MSLTYATASSLKNKIDRMSSLKSYQAPNAAQRPAGTVKTLTVGSGVTSTTGAGTPPVSENCLYFPGNSTGYIVPDSTADVWSATGNNTTNGGLNNKLWIQTQGQFTIEFNAYFSNYSSSGVIEFGGGGYAIGFHGANIYFGHSQSSYGLEFSFSPSNNTWYNIAFTRSWPSGSAPTYECFKNGVSLGTQLDSYYYTGTSSFGGLTMPAIGNGNGGGGFWMSGYMQEFRMSNINRYTAGNFTPSTVPFVNDSNTILLIHGTSPIQDDPTNVS
jgi:hypothetical protein